MVSCFSCLVIFSLHFMLCPVVEVEILVLCVCVCMCVCVCVCMYVCVYLCVCVCVFVGHKSQGSNFLSFYI